VTLIFTKTARVGLKPTENTTATSGSSTVNLFGSTDAGRLLGMSHSRGCLSSTVDRSPQRTFGRIASSGLLREPSINSNRLYPRQNRTHVWLEGYNSAEIEIHQPVTVRRLGLSVSGPGPAYCLYRLGFLKLFPRGNMHGICFASMAVTEAVPEHIKVE